MAVEGQFPKVDGDVFYASELNSLDSLNIASGLQQYEVSVTQSNANKTIANATVWYVKNTGSEDVYINFGAAATTSKFFLKPNEEIQFQLQQTQLNYICDTGKTSTLSIIAGVGTWKKHSNFFSIKKTINNSSTNIYDSATTYVNWLINNCGDKDVFVRFAATAVTTDYKIKVGQSLIINYPSKRLCGIVSSGTGEVRVWAVG